VCETWLTRPRRSATSIQTRLDADVYDWIGEEGVAAPSLLEVICGLQLGLFGLLPI